MNTFALKCLQLLIFWVKWPLQQIWLLVSGKGGSARLWLLLAAVVCIAGLVMDILLHHVNRKFNEDGEQTAEQHEQKRQAKKQRLQPDLSVFRKPKEEEKPAEQPSPAFEGPIAPIFDEKLPPVQPIQAEPAEQAINSSRRRRPLRDQNAALQNAVIGGKQTIHSMDEMEYSNNPNRLTRLAQRAISFVNIGGEGEAPNHGEFQSSIKRSEAFFEPVYPDSYRSRPEEKRCEPSSR